MRKWNKNRIIGNVLLEIYYTKCQERKWIKQTFHITKRITRQVSSILGLGSMGNVCCSKILSARLQRVKIWAGHCYVTFLFMRGNNMYLLNRKNLNAIPTVFYQSFVHYVVCVNCSQSSKIWANLSKQLVLKMPVTRQVAACGSQILQHLKALTLRCLSICDFTWESVGIKRCALHNAEKIILGSKLCN